uniref:Xylulose kinase-1 n=1 Tax=Tanacetum cinerariifolium TaxID=118510 RepID=A0A6L2LUP2_TANCI|nr:xylulose kinase-1 [Tanacetum cinerariifolium]
MLLDCVLLLLVQDNAVRQNDIAAKETEGNTNGMINVLPPKTAKEVVARERERKARTNLLMALPKDHLAKFYKMADAKKMWEAIKSKFGGNDESKKMHNFDDLYNNIRVFERDVKGTTASSSSNTQNVAFVSADNTSSTNADDSKALVTIDREDIDWSGHVEEDTQNYAIMAYSSSNSCSNNEVQSCSKKLYDEERDKIGDASVEIIANTLALKKIEAQLLCHQLAYEQKTSVVESYSKSSESASCESNSSVETTTSMHAPVKDVPKVVSKPKVWTDALIIKEYESDSDDDSVSNSQEEK